MAALWQTLNTDLGRVLCQEADRCWDMIHLCADDAAEAELSRAALADYLEEHDYPGEAGRVRVGDLVPCKVGTGWRLEVLPW